MCKCCRSCCKGFMKLLLVICVILGIPLLINHVYFKMTFDWEGEILKDGGKFVVLDDGRYFEYFENGNDKSSEIILVIPGFGATGWGLSKFIETNEKLKKNHLFFTITLPGFGGSTVKKDRTLEEFYQDIEEFLTKIGHIDREVVVYGGSMGSLHTYALACSNESKLKLKKIILAAPVCLNTTQNISYAQLKLSMPLYYFFGYLFYNYPEFLLKNNEGMKDCFDFPADVVEREYEDFRRCGKFSYIGYPYNAILPGKPTSLKCSQKRMEEVRDKIVIVYGEKDLIAQRYNLDFYLNIFGFDYNDKNILKYDEGHCVCSRRMDEAIFRALEL